MADLMQMIGEPKDGKCEGTDGFKLPEDEFVDVTEYYKDGKLLGADCEFRSSDGLCIANKAYSGSGRYSQVMCKYTNKSDGK